MLKYKEIKQLGKVITGKTPPTEDESNFGGSIPFITPSDIKSFNEHYIVDTERTISESGSRYVSKNILPNDSICFVCIGSTIGKMCMTGTPSYTNQQLNSIIPFANVDNHYLFYLLRYFKGYFQLLGGGTGSGKGIVKKSTFEKSKVLYDDNIDNQKKIASILSAYDSLIENNKKRIKLLEQMAENLYKEWFVRFRFPGYETAEFEGGVPKGWKRVSLREYANVIMGQSPESCFYNTEKLGLPFHQGCGSYGEFYLRDDIYSTEGKRIAEPNSIIFSVRAPVGRINLTLNKIILGRGVAGINAKNNNNAFLLWLLKQKFSKEDIIGNGAIFTSVTKNELLGQKLLIPNKELERKFNVIASNIETEIKLLTLQKEVLTTQRDLLLPRLMSGKLSI